MMFWVFTSVSEPVSVSRLPFGLSGTFRRTSCFRSSRARISSSPSVAVSLSSPKRQKAKVNYDNGSPFPHRTLHIINSTCPSTKCEYRQIHSPHV